MSDDRDVGVEHLDGGDAERDGNERTGDAWRCAPEPHDDGERRGADEQGGGMGVAEVGDDVPCLLEEVAAALGDAEQLGDLADDDRQREADDEPLEHGLADEVRQEPEPQHTGDQRREPGRERQAGGEGGEPVVADRDDIRDGGRRERGGSGHRSGHQVARAAEGGVEDQRARRGVQADDRRDAGDRRVGQRLRHQHGPHRQAGDQVAAQPRPLVPVQ